MNESQRHCKMISKGWNNNKSVLVTRYQSIGIPIEIIAGGGCAIEGTTKLLDASKAVRRHIKNATLFQNRKLKYLRKIEVIMRIAVFDQGTN